MSLKIEIFSELLGVPSEAVKGASVKLAVSKSQMFRQLVAEAIVKDFYANYAADGIAFPYVDPLKGRIYPWAPSKLDPWPKEISWRVVPAWKLIGGSDKIPVVEGATVEETIARVAQAIHDEITIELAED